MQSPIVTRAEGLHLVCEKIIEQFDSGSLKKACFKVLEQAGEEGERILLALKGIRDEGDLSPPVCRYIKRIAEEIHLPYEEVLDDIRAFVKN